MITIIIGMVVAVFSDVHSNAEALEVFVNETYGKVDRYVCLGDIVGYGPDPNICISIVKALCGTGWAIRGNHDRALLDLRLLSGFNYMAAEAILWTLDKLSDTELNYIRELNDVIDYNHYVFVHGSIIDPDEYIVSRLVAKRNIERLIERKKKVMFFGHTHLPAIWTSEGLCEIEYNKIIYLDQNKVYLINPGSIGQPRDNNPLGSYLIFNDVENYVIFKRFKYDVDKTYSKIVRRGLPEYLGRRLRFGI